MSHAKNIPRAALVGLLDTGLLSGQHEVRTVLRPERAARPVAVDDMAGLHEEIERACQVWGGGCQPLLPVSRTQMSEHYDQLLRVEQIDLVGGLQNVEVTLPHRVKGGHPWDYPVLAVASHEPLERWPVVSIVELDDNDPWQSIYEAILGRWPKVPDEKLSEFADLREDLRFEEVVRVERVAAIGSLGDLFGRLEDREFVSPRSFSNVFLAHGMHPDMSFIRTGEDVLPDPRATKRAAGPNLIVAIGPDSVEDIALLWNLRGAHGSEGVMPIGVPVDQIDGDVLRELQKPGRARMFGFDGGVCHLVSVSIPLDDLEKLAAESPTVQAVSYETVLTFGPAPGRIRSRVSSWNDGETRLSPMSEGDLDILRGTRAVGHKPRLILDVSVDLHPLPADATMRGSDWAGRFQAGAAQVEVSELAEERTVRVEWPSSWTCLAAIGQSRGLKVRESEPGIAAATLIRGLGGIEEIRHLQHEPLISLMYRMAEPSGMTWWKNRWSDAHRKLLDAVEDPSTLDRAAEVIGRDDLVVAPAGEGRAVPFRDFVKAVGSEVAARHWVYWAERRHLLVRGADIVCPDCRARSWLPLAALPPPIPCPGCGRQIEQPYGARELKFTYRLGEPLRRVLETDSFGHVLALYWFVALFRGRGLVGAHPGVIFEDPVDNGRTIGEADIVILFADGSVVPVEVKRRLAGADERTAELMDVLATALDAPWDALVVSQASRSVPSLKDARRSLPGRPRMVLTNDQIHSEHIVWLLGHDPFAWDPQTIEEDLVRQKAFSNGLAQNDPDVPWDRLSEALLDRTTGY